MNGERLKLCRLLLLAPGAFYEVVFHDGVNIIAGPIFTGKTAVLDLIDYCLGSQDSPSFPEIRKCSDVLLECQVGGEHLTIRRPLGRARHALIYFECTIENLLENEMPFEEVLAVHSKGQRSISSILMSKLGLADIQVKAAPTKEASEQVSFSLRDLMAFLYVPQDRMGLKNGFFEDL